MTSTVVDLQAYRLHREAVEKRTLLARLEFNPREATIRLELDLRRQAMRRRGISRPIISRELEILERELRTGGAR